MRISTALAALLLALVFFASAAYAQTSKNFDLSWSTVDTGGATFSTSGSYRLGGTAGQQDAGIELTNTSFRVLGGFWGVTLVVPPVPSPIPGLTNWGLIAMAALLFVVVLRRMMQGGSRAAAR